MDKALEAKIQMQEKAKRLVRLANYIASLIITVGGGKGKIMLDLASELVAAGKVKSILYLCDSQRLRDSDTQGFPAEIEKWGSHLKHMITLECYQTTRKWEGKHYDLVLGDEVDFAMTTAYCKVFFNNTFKYKILVSGTLTPEKKKLLLTIAPIVFRFTTTQAEEAGIINKSKYYLYNYKLTEKESAEYVRLTKAIQRAAAAESPYMNKLLSARKEFLYTLDSSFNHCKKILARLKQKDPNRRTIIFTQRTKQANRFDHSFHGKNEKENKFDDFQEGIISDVAVVSKVQRGLNVKNANTGLYESLNGSTTGFEQKNGRLKRLEIHKFAHVIFMVPWFKKVKEDGSVEYRPTIVDEWVGNATGNLPIDFINLKL